jgi:hypothetical protein
MKLLFGLTILILIAVSLYADRLWKRWIKVNREARDRDRQN